MLVWRLIVTAASMQTEPIIPLFLEAFALPVGPLHILSSNQRETGGSVRLEGHAKQCLGERLFSSDTQPLPSRRLAFFSLLQIRTSFRSSLLSTAPSCLLSLRKQDTDPREAGSQ